MDDDSSFERANAYAYGSWQAGNALRRIGGASCDFLQFPRNGDLPRGRTLTASLRLSF